MRIAITGMGGELGTGSLACLLEADERVTAVMGVDIEPPRRRLRRAEFHRVDPRDRDRMVTTIAGSPRRRSCTSVSTSPMPAPVLAAPSTRTAIGTIAAVTAAAGRRHARGRIVVRSGIEVYGRGPGTRYGPTRRCAPIPRHRSASRCCTPNGSPSTAAPGPTSPSHCLRFAPVVGPHVPSPLGRFLRLPAVPVPVLGSARFCVLHQEDAAAAVVAAVTRRPQGPVNVVGRGAVTPLEAVRLGGGVPVPTWGPGWRVAAVATEVAGAPLPDHVIELLTRGRLADGDRVAELLGVAPTHTTPEVVGRLHEWAAFLPDSSRPAA